MPHNISFWCIWAVANFVQSVSPSPAAAQSGFPALSTIRLGGASSAAATSSDVLGNPTAAPIYPPPTVPPTADAPFMQKSPLPRGTVFICAGASLGGLLVLVLSWRAWVALSIRRSMEKSGHGYISLVHPMPEQRSILSNGVHILKRPYLFYKQPPEGSQVSLQPLRCDEQKMPQEQTQAKAPDKQKLYFSPTASSGNQMIHLGSRSANQYLPSGYYAATSSTKTHSGSRSSMPISHDQESLRDISSEQHALSVQTSPFLEYTDESEEIGILAHESGRAGTYFGS